MLKMDYVDLEARYVIKRLGNLLTKQEIQVLEKEMSNVDKQNTEFYYYLKDFLKKKSISIIKNYKNLSDYFRYLEEIEKLYQ